MKKIFGLIIIFASMTFIACSEDNTKSDDSTMATEAELNTVINNYVDNVVIPTYADMENKIAALKTHVDAFIADGTQKSLDAACTAWRAARNPWELSEAFLFGPADYLGLDPMLDSWPLDKDAIDAILANLDFKEVDGDENIRGFHTLEYLLFEGGSNKVAANISSSQKQYMAKVSSLLDSDTKKLHSEWVNNYGSEFKTHSSDRIISAYNAVAQIVEGCIDIAGEVGEQKIGNPYQLYTAGKTEEGVLAVESWYSWNSLTDYRNNILSIQNSYLGGTSNSRNDANSLSALVRQYNEATDKEIKQAITDAISAIDNIPAPFRNHLEAKTEIEAAQDILAELQISLLKIKSALGID